MSSFKNIYQNVDFFKRIFILKFVQNRNFVTVENRKIYLGTLFIDNFIFNIYYLNIFSLKIDIHKDISEKRNLGAKQPPKLKFQEEWVRRLLVCYSGLRQST